MYIRTHLNDLNLAVAICRVRADIAYRVEVGEVGRCAGCGGAFSAAAGGFGSGGWGGGCRAWGRRESAAAYYDSDVAFDSNWTSCDRAMVCSIIGPSETSARR